MTKLKIRKIGSITSNGRIWTRSAVFTNSENGTTMIVTQIAVLTQNRQNQTLRRATTSSSRSCWLSSPNRLGRGIMRWKMRSTSPRKQTTTKSAARIDQYQAQPSF